MDTATGPAQAIATTPAARQWALRERRRAAGLCLECGGARERPSRWLCKVCFQAQKAANRRHYSRARESGQCTRCRRQAEPGRSLCAEHTRQRSQYLRQYRSRQRDARSGQI